MKSIYKTFVICLLLVTTILLTTCIQQQAPHKFIINGEIVMCEYMQYYKCGVHISNCSNGREYSCMTNLELVK